MADKKISALTAASTPLAGTEVLPIVKSGSTVKVSVADLTAGRTFSAASLGLGTTLPAYVFDFRSGSTATVGSFSSSNSGAYSASGYNGTVARLFLNGGGATGAANGIEFTAGGNNESFFGTVQEAGGSAAFVFQGYNGSIYREYFRIGSSGDVTLTNGNAVIGTAGKGIDFSANTHAAGMTSELLNWYEEGTWTPTVQFGTGNTGMTVTASGRYTRVGRTVTIQVNIAFTAKGASTGNFRFDLPFSAGAKASGAMGFNYSWATMPTGGISFMADGGFVYGMPANIGGYIDDTYFNNGTTIDAITITYTV